MTRPAAPRFFVDTPLAAGPRALPDGAARHAQVRRLQPGDALVLFDGRGGEWDAAVTRMARQGVDVEVHTHRAVSRELATAVTLALGMPANERMDFVIEKATELGAGAIVPLVCERSVLRLDGERALRRREHWQGIAQAAAEQSGRTRVPAVHAVRPLAAWLTDSAGAAGADAAAPARWLLSLAPGAVRPGAHGAAVPAAVCVLSGPEGGLTADEQARAVAAGFAPVSLGPRVLRADTAPLAVLAWLGLGGD